MQKFKILQHPLSHFSNGGKKKNKKRNQAGAELCQAQAQVTFPAGAE